ncbi:hypothetical protein Poli38472_003221 [Pythium oligandrum]|uniref:Uncharacterized protein n=1 Tax=Pythium oligandrum TaxID=41045 RepID=A0A8K1C6G3_PYTOL|nr:hypothetical protein Poli38472_003221 [Pythium oligandrum]|eukprot:TMW57296.1 hypothetical protein Poli38472_003221 [Pythium oligandrum]
MRMSLFCSCLSRRRSDHNERLYQEQFERIRGVYPGTDYACLLNAASGEIIAQTEIPVVNTEELARTIVTLKRAAQQFATTLTQVESQVVHVKGDDRMFSCFGGEGTILAFYTQMPGVNLELFDCNEADKTVHMINTELMRLAGMTSHHALRRAHAHNH